MRRFAPLAALALALAAAPSREAAAQGVLFSEGRPFAEALRRARAEKKPLMVDAYAVWCGPCKQLDRMTFADESVGTWAKKNVIAVKLDAEKGEGRRVAQRYAVRAFPTILFIDPSGNELDRISGVFGPADFIRAAQSILEGRTPLGEAIARLGKTWDPELAGSIAAQLAQKNDLARLLPIARRAVEEDPELAEPGARDAFLYRISLEDAAEKLSPEALDVIETVASRFGDDPRVAILHLVAQPHDLVGEAPVLEQLSHLDAQRVDLEGFGEEVDRAELHRLHGVVVHRNYTAERPARVPAGSRWTRGPGRCPAPCA